jgi:hypothetical protein
MSVKKQERDVRLQGVDYDRAVMKSVCICVFYPVMVFVCTLLGGIYVMNRTGIQQSVITVSITVFVSLLCAGLFAKALVGAEKHRLQSGNIQENGGPMYENELSEIKSIALDEALDRAVKARFLVTFVGVLALIVFLAASVMAISDASVNTRAVAMFMALAICVSATFALLSSR